jgi:hypothetical protein
VLATCFPYSPNVSLRRSGAVGSYHSVSAISGYTWFGRACKWRVGIWLTGNLRVEVVVEQGASFHRESERTYSRKVSFRY